MPAHNRSVKDDHFFFPPQCPVKQSIVLTNPFVFIAISQGKPLHRSLPKRTSNFLPLMKKVTKEISAAEKLAKISLFHCCAWKLSRPCLQSTCCACSSKQLW